MSEMLSLKPENATILHHKALEWFNLLRSQIESTVPLEELSNDDLNMFLTDDDKLEWIRCQGEIALNLAAMKAGINLLVPMNNLKFLLKKVKERKVLKAKEEQRKLEEDEKRSQEEERKRQEEIEKRRREEEAEKRWSAARKAVDPPLDDAKRYLDDQEYEEFEKAGCEAIKVYQEISEDYLKDSRTFDYRHSLWVINYRKEEERQQIAAKIEEEQIRNDAQAQAQGFRARLNQGLKEIEKMLSPEKEDPAVIFKRWCSNNGEKRYLGELFTDILASDDARNGKWTQGYIPVAEAKLRQSIPEELRDFILMQPTVAFFLLPRAHYAHYGVPCLDFYFDVFAVVTITVLAQAGEKVFNRYKFNFLTNLQEPKRLGFYQITVTPNQPNFWQSVPLTILYALMDGNLQPPGTTILQRTDELTIYEVKKFEDDICEFPISFERYCRSLGSIDRMKELQIINERTAEILEPPRPININHKESKSKKTQAFELFDEGKRPSDLEVKNLGIKPNSLYRYYQDWKKVHSSSKNPT